MTGTVPYLYGFVCVQLFAQVARLRPGIKCRDWSKLCTDPCKHHCNRICTDPCKQAVQEQNSSVQKIFRTRVNGALACSTGVFWTREYTSGVLGHHLGFGNCGGLGRGNIYPLPVKHPKWRHQKLDILFSGPLQNNACTAGYHDLYLSF